MKRNCLVALFAFALAVSGRTDTVTPEFYVNDSIVNCPPQIPPQVNSTNFINNNLFSIVFTNSSFQLYKTANTLNYTNFAVMIGNNGFQFDNGPTGSGQRRMARSFDNPGVITAGTVLNLNPFVTNLPGPVGAQLPQIIISATNVTMNSGSNVVGLNGLFSLTGKSVDLNRATITVESSTNSSSAGISDGYWGIPSTNATITIAPSAQFGTANPTTGFHLVTRPGNVLNFQNLTLPGAVAYVVEGFDGTGTNRYVQVAFVRNANTNITNHVNLNLNNGNNGVITVEWAATFINPGTGLKATNYLYLRDTFSRFGNLNLIPHFASSGQTTFQPANFAFSLNGPQNIGANASPSSTTGMFDPLVVTNDFAAYQANFSPATVLPSQLGQPILSNLPGRVEISADDVLNLSRARISGPNYMRLTATNHFAGAAGASIGAAYSDFYLGSTNGVLNITNLISPSLPRLSGLVNVWSGRWTNDFDRPGNGPSPGLYHTIYHVLFVDSQITPTSSAQIQDLSLRSTNKLGGADSIVISDVLNVSRTLLIDSQRLTLTANPLAVPPARGEINILSSAITWPGATPRLQYLTNNGAISSLNSVFFGGSRTSPFFTSNYNEPYLAFVNRGPVSTEGSLIWANYFENSGAFSCGTGFGSIALESQVTRLTNGSFISAKGDVSITTGSLTVSNHILQAGRRLTLSVTNLLTDTGVSNANNWAVGKGFSLTTQPNNGDLLGTTILDAGGDGAEVTHVWAGQDRGCSLAGFANNAALGRLILDGGSGTVFRFLPATYGNALYVDLLDFRDHTTTSIINGSGNVDGVEIEAGMKIYYAQALATDGTVAERINGANGGRFCWVAAYTGIYSSTSLVYGDGTTNIFNAALVASCNLDSDGDGLVNCIDPEPILRAQDLAFSVVVTNKPPKGALVSWRSIPGSTNQVYFRTSLTTGAWQTLTNFVNPNPALGTVSVFDPVAANATRYYRVRVDAPQP